MTAQSSTFSTDDDPAIRYLHSFPTRRSSDLNPAVVQVDLGDNGSADFSFQRAEIGTISIRGGAGDDRVRIDDTNAVVAGARSEEHTSELQSRFDPVCRLLLEKKILHTTSSRR